MAFEVSRHFATWLRVWNGAQHANRLVQRWHSSVVPKSSHARTKSRVLEPKAPPTRPVARSRKPVPDTVYTSVTRGAGQTRGVGPNLGAAGKRGPSSSGGGGGGAATKKNTFAAAPANQKPKVKRFMDIVPPAPIAIPNYQDADGASSLNKEDVSRILENFARRPLVRELCEENKVSRKMFHAAYKSFRNYCLNASPLDARIEITISDILMKARDVDSIYPYFIEHARKVYPHLECEKELKTLSDLTKPHNWYPKAREVFRKIYFHAGPTNSGKTYQALQRFNGAKTGFYCGPLRLLASEICAKTNELGVKCDLVTGEERRYAVDSETPSSHVAMTVEMVPVDVNVEVAVIDEIQMLRDASRGWAWTRALLGIAAEEIHLCGEEAAIDIVRSLLDPIGEHVEVNRYERKTPLFLSKEPLRKLDNVQDGDCLVCFSVAMLFTVAKKLMKIGIQPTVIYGALPPWTKLNQAKAFNEMVRKPNVMIATDAIGMGLNLNIRRIIFVQFPFGEHQANYHVVQVAGRAGRFNSAYEKGYATALRQADMSLLEGFMNEPISAIETAGIAPTCEQLETFSYHLPHASFLSIIDMFISISSLSKKYHLCDVDQFRRLAELIDDIPLSMKARYAFCTAPVDIEVDSGVARACFVRLARRFSEGKAITADWFRESIQWPLPKPMNVAMLLDMCKLYNLIDLYLWLSYKFPDSFPDREKVRELGKILESYINDAITAISNIAVIEAENVTVENESNDVVAVPEKEETVTDRLIRQGVLSEKEWARLKEEIRKEELTKLTKTDDTDNAK